MAILDIEMPGLSGLHIKEELNKNESMAGLPLIFLTACSTVEDKVNGLNTGADDYITKPFHEKELLARVKSILNKKKLYDNLFMKDSLTGLYNRHYFNRQFKLFFDISRRYGKVFSVAMVDLNGLKKINDTFGHNVGDTVIRKTGEIIKGIFRRSDIVTRFGGDEFVVIMPETNKEQAEAVIEKLEKKNHARINVTDEKSGEIIFSVSAGTATYSADIEDETSLLKLADINMYEHKKTSKLKY